MTPRLSDVVAELGGELRGDGQRELRRLGTLADADAHTLTFLANPRYLRELGSTAAAGVIVAPAQADQRPSGCAAIVTDDPYRYFARLTRWWAVRTRPQPTAGVHPAAVVDATAQVDPTAHVGAGAVIEAGAQVHAGAMVGPACIIGRDAVVGEDTRLTARVTLMHGCRIGRRCIVHPGAVIGADGFGFAPHEGRWEKIEQLGGVRIGDDVEIGANTCIDRGALGDTVIEDGVKLDNLIQIAHNVHVGAHTAMAACVGIAGSTRIGAHCTLGGASGVVGHVTIADHVNISAHATVSRSISRPGTYSGSFPLDEHRNWEKNAATLRQLHALRERIRELERRHNTNTPTSTP